MIDINKCKITHYPSEVLTKSSNHVEKIDDNIRGLVNKMIDIMIEKKGIGLAAPQAGVPLRLFIVSLDGSRESLKVYVNPKVTTAGELDSVEEGCLSVPGIYTKIKRYKKCTVTATGLDGKEFTEEADGLYARCLQHEYDHIEGMTIADRMGTASKIVYRHLLKKLEDQQEAGQL
jgi:peptide deformylase